MVSCVRQRPSAVPARGEDQRHEPGPRDTSADGLHEVSGEADGAGENHAPVRNDRSRKRRRPFSGARTAGGGVPDWLPGWVFAAVTVAPALLAVAWLVPGIGMLLAGRLLPVPMVIIFVPLAVALCYFAMRRMPARWPRFGAAEPDAPPAPAPRGCGAAAAGAGGDAGLAVLAMVAVAAGFGVWQAWLRSEQVLRGGRPGGVPAVRVLDRRARDGADAGVGGRVRRGGGAGLRDDGVHACRGVRSRRRSCRGCRWCWRAGRGWAGSAGRC